jgi:mannose-6-phosphate isomerase-like protein (cupin superfamily)
MENLMKVTIHPSEVKELNTIGLSYGTMILVCETNEFSISVNTLFPRKKLPTYYYKTGCELIYILEGEGECPKKPVKKNDWIKVEAQEKFWLANTSEVDILRFLIICIPAYSDEDCVWLD